MPSSSAPHLEPPRTILCSITSAASHEPVSLLRKPRALRPPTATGITSTTTLSTIISSQQQQRGAATCILPEEDSVDPRMHDAPRLPMELQARPEEPQFLLHFRPRSMEELQFPDLSSVGAEATTTTSTRQHGSPKWVDLAEGPPTSSSDDEEPLQQCCLWLRPRPSKRQRRAIVS